MATHSHVWISETPPSSPTWSRYNDTGRRKRRHHHKSRGACAACRARRIKCNEVRPRCGYCVEKKASCSYPSELGLAPSKHVAPIPLTSEDTSKDSDLGRVISAAIDRQYLQNWPILGSGALESMLEEHFKYYSDKTWLFTSLFQSTMQEHGLHIGSDRPYLRHAIAAVSATHFTFLHPEERSFEAVARARYGKSLHTYGKALSQPMDVADAEAATAACIVHSILAFYYMTIASAEPCGPLDATAFSWMASFRGIYQVADRARLADVDFRIIRCGTRFLKLRRSETKQSVQTPELETFVCNMSGLSALCGVARGTTGEVTLYTRPLQRLERLMLGKLTPERLGEFLLFLEGLDDEFMTLVYTLESRALLLISFWLARLCKLEQWWITQGAVRLCHKICRHLEAIPDVRPYLAFPISACGFALASNR